MCLPFGDEGSKGCGFRVILGGGAHGERDSGPLAPRGTAPFFLNHYRQDQASRWDELLFHRVSFMRLDGLEALSQGYRS